MSSSRTTLKAARPKAWLVGAGPGDPELLTLKALRALKRAQIVFYDNLVSDEILGLVDEGVECVSVGKIGGGKHTRQEEIHARMYEALLEGKEVVRLKGGDPFVFGRGGEEALYLMERGFEAEVVPGISSCISVPQSMGIPVTHRGVSTHFSVVTAMGRQGKGTNLEQVWVDLAKTGGTLVVLMGLRKLEHIVHTLVEGGIASTTPIALVQAGTTADAVCIKGTLEDIVAQVRQAALGSPALIVIGEVVRMHDELMRCVRDVSSTNPQEFSNQRSQWL